MTRFRFVTLLCAVVLTGFLAVGAVVNGTPQPSPNDISAALSLSDSHLHFGTVDSGSTTTLWDRVQNTGTLPIVIYAISLRGKGFHYRGPDLPFTLAPGTAFSWEVLFTPTLAGAYSGSFNLQYKWDGATPHWSSKSIEVFGTAEHKQGQISATHPLLHFGIVDVSGSKSILETLMNRSGNALTISQIAVSGKAFSFSGIDPPVTLKPGESISFPVLFAPSLSGPSSGSLSIHSNASNSTVLVALGGTGSAPGRLFLNPASINFGKVRVGSRQNQTVMLVATAGPVTVSSADLNNTEFSISGISLPTTIAAGGRTSMTLTFSPQSSGSATGVLVVNAREANSRATASMAGTGSQPSQHAVDLAWDPSTSSDTVGYHVYRGTQSGGPYSPITSAVETGTTASDNTVAAGQVYYYVVTAVNGNSEESSYSNEERAAVPLP